MGTLPEKQLYFLTFIRISVFAAACVKAVSGEASLPERSVVTAIDLFRYLSQFYQNVNWADDLDRGSESSATSNAFQAPVLFIPEGMGEAALNPVCHRCCEPPAPDRPVIRGIGKNEVEICWSVPEFDGAPSINYRVQMRNLTRNFNLWKQVDYRGVITPLSFKIRNMPSGVHSKFRVEAFNQGGWSAASEETEYVCPGSAVTQPSKGVGWNRMAMGGSLSVVDHMSRHPYSREDALRGLRLLVVFGQRDIDFHKGKIQLKVAQRCIEALKTFRNDPEVIHFLLEVSQTLNAKQGDCSGMYGVRIHPQEQQIRSSRGGVDQRGSVPAS